MSQHPADLYVFVAVLCLPLAVRLLMLRRVWGPIRATFGPLLVRVWGQWTREEADEAVLELLAVARLQRLQRHLDRVQRLVGNDDHMPATRQVGNRLALERLRCDVREATAAASAAGVSTEPVAPPSRSRWAGAAAAQPYVEVMELGPARRSPRPGARS